jgi:hypothetical protein
VVLAAESVADVGSDGMIAREWTSRIHDVCLRGVNGSRRARGYAAVMGFCPLVIGCIIFVWVVGTGEIR